MRRVLLLLLLTSGCDSKQSTTAPSATASVIAEPAPPPSALPPAPSKCKAGKDRPTQIGTIVGDVEAIAVDDAHLYYASWDLYGNRGNLGAIRKDGQGSTRITSLELEPRGLLLDGGDIYYTGGIRLARIAKAGGEPNVFAPEFSAQRIALFGSDIYGVPGDYGPYDRVARVPKKGGDTQEVSSSKRPAKDVKPNGFNAIAVDASGVYVTDSGGGRVLKLPLEKGPPKPLATGQPQAFDLALVSSTLYFTLARKGDLMKVSTSGGPVKKLASGLAQDTRIAADEQAIFATRAGKESEPQAITRIAPNGSEVTPVAVVPAGDTVAALALDADCVFWTVRSSPGSATVWALAR